MGIDYKNTKSFQEGVEMFKAKYSPEHYPLIDKLYDFSPALADIIFSYGMCGIWGEKTPSLTILQKELAVFGALSALGGEEIKLHTKNLLNVGLSQQQVKELLVLLSMYVGISKTIDNIEYVIEAFEEHGKTQRKKS